MLNSENLKYFDSGRPEFKPYGFTVEKWTPKIMSRPDRHNEIELNLLKGGSLTYLINDRKVVVEAKKLAIFWALIPHQIINFKDESPYYVCTIPFAQFMNWQLPPAFVDHILSGDLVHTITDEEYQHDEFLMERWLEDALTGDERHVEVSAMEICARLHRFALHSTPAKGNELSMGDAEYAQLDIVEKMTVYIAKNFHNPIKNENVAKAVGLHPDYANTVFKKSFGITLNQYILSQRILYARRQLSISDKSITEIAYEAGFNSLSRFNAAFKEKCNRTPREYRKFHAQKFRNGF